MLRILVIVDEVLFIVDHEIRNASRDRMVFVHHAHLEGPHRVADIGASHDIAVILGRERHMAVVVHGIKILPQP